MNKEREMTPLTQQLEDKKKELELLSKSISRNNIEYIRRLNSEIAILEQAIAEMQKQRQEILKLIKQEISKDAYSYTFECRLNNFLKNGLKKQLNQPKTEQ